MSEIGVNKRTHKSPNSCLLKKKQKNKRYCNAGSVIQYDSDWMGGWGHPFEWSMDPLDYHSVATKGSHSTLPMVLSFLC